VASQPLPAATPDEAVASMRSATSMADGSLVVVASSRRCRCVAVGPIRLAGILQREAAMPHCEQLATAHRVRSFRNCCHAAPVRRYSKS
jgi:hypothetical protein